MAGSTTTSTGAPVVDATHIARGWSAKIGILAKTVTNEVGATVDKAMG